MALEVTSDLRFELSNLNYICYHAFLACKGFLEMIQTTPPMTTGQLSSIDERCTLVKIDGISRTEIMSKQNIGPVSSSFGV